MEGVARANWRRVRRRAGGVFEKLDLQVSLCAGILVEWNGDGVERG
jgi:hypothetical protein